jgi:hypothetical protein
MIELLISVCLIHQPATCKDVHLSYVAEALTPYACLMRAQPELARWAEAHPKWRIEKWRCQDPKQVAKI